MAEVFVPLPGYEGRYEVSDAGRIASYYRNPVTKRCRRRILKAAANASGHLFVYLGRGRKTYIHRAVLEAFVGPAPPGCECLHGPDPNPANNTLRNLRWGTRAENVAEARAHDPAILRRQARSMRRYWATKRNLI